MWVRFPKFYIEEDYFCMENYAWDAVAFVPKRNIKFHGFGVLAIYVSSVYGPFLSYSVATWGLRKFRHCFPTLG